MGGELRMLEQLKTLADKLKFAWARVCGPSLDLWRYALGEGSYQHKSFSLLSPRCQHDFSCCSMSSKGDTTVPKARGWIAT